jgi:hypothetical protein
VLDVTIPNTVNNITTVLMRLLSALIIIVFVTPVFTAVLVPVMLLYLFILVSLHFVGRDYSSSDSTSPHRAN